MIAFDKKDFKWAQIPIVGMGLIILNPDTIDSHGNKINPKDHYIVGKHKKTGKVLTYRIPLEELADFKCTNKCGTPISLRFDQENRALYMCFACGNTYSTIETLEYNDHKII